MQTDPIGYKDNMDLYTYVGDDPVNKTDPTGLEECGEFKYYCSQINNSQWEVRKYTEQGQPVEINVWGSNNNPECQNGNTCATDDKSDSGAPKPKTPDLSKLIKLKLPEFTFDDDEAKPDKKPDSKPDTKPDSKPNTKPDSRPSTKPDSKPNTKPDSKPPESMREKLRRWF